MRRRKYNNVKTEIDGIMFDSKKEAKRYQQLKLLKRAGEITDLRLQVPFILAPQVKYSDALSATPAMKYVADFVYTNSNGEQVVEDVKGFKTGLYKAKRHLMLAYKGIEVKEI